MAKRRMFNIDIMTSDSFMSLTSQSQLLYMQLNLMADDDGFIGNAKGIMRLVSASRKHLNILVEKGYLIEFDSGIVLVRHWHVHNQMRKDRHVPTRYVKELNSVYIKDGVYTMRKNGAEKGEENSHGSDFFGNQMATQYSIEEISQVEESSDEVSEDKKRVVARTEAEEDSPETEDPSDSEENESGDTDTPSIEVKSFYDTLSDEQRRKYNNFLNTVRLHFMSEYNTTACDKFIKYNEARFWCGRRGESVIDNFKKYAKEWVEHDMIYTLSHF